MLQNIISGFTQVATLPALGLMVFGAVLGVVVGAIPGLTGTMAIALILPMTLYMSPWLGIPLILAIYKASQWGGAISAILINTPGNAAGAAMTIEGYPLSKQGKAGKALRASLYSGVTGDVFSDLVTIFVCAPIAMFALLFGPSEFMLLVVLALLVIAMMGEGKMLKSLISAAFGIFISCMGYDPVASTPRLMFGIVDIGSGIQLVPLLIGAFALSETIIKLLSDERSDESVKIEMEKNFYASQEKENNRYSFKEFRQNFWVILRSGVIGTIIGALPGIGSSVSPWIGYSVARKTTKHPEEYGKGSVEGLVACQSACNAVSGANLIPLLTLGIPGDTVAAMLIGTLMVHGLSPGPLIFQKNPVAVYSIFSTLLICNVIYFLVGLVTVKYAANITKIRNAVLTPFIIILCVVGAYAFNRSSFDVYIMLIFGVIGYIMKANDFNVPVFTIAFILGPMLEVNMRQALILFDGDLTKTLSRPITLVLFIIAVASVAIPLIRWSVHKFKILRNRGVDNEVSN